MAPSPSTTFGEEFQGQRSGRGLVSLFPETVETNRASNRANALKILLYGLFGSNGRVSPTNPKILPCFRHKYGIRLRVRIIETAKGRVNSTNAAMR